jgi:hypothetical protein
MEVQHTSWRLMELKMTISINAIRLLIPYLLRVQNVLNHPWPNKSSAGCTDQQKSHTKIQNITSKGELTTSLLVWYQDEPIDQCNNMWEYHSDRIKDAEKSTILGGSVLVGRREECL